MKVRASIKPRCDKCRLIRRNRIIRIICTNPRHNQKQG
ncbi:MAG: 50S ribosomal protein L36 [Chloroflexi bacterium]|nr:50S ribosomal protein L36 [Chloroflexota bacterium]MBI68197.1 50S ribosomal protein L36 [Chloroflexota bacterium]MCH2532276.1 50S ribosomal protein L36 [Dehalococcoidia bacterium]HCH35790.1 50S ribosomal protein L36 [Dehalococcoidia bacterium]